MGKLSENVHAFPFIAGVIAIIALVCPAAFYVIPQQDMGYGILVWMFGLAIYREKGGSKVYFMNIPLDETVDIFGAEFFGFLTSMVCTATIAIAALILIKTAQSVKHGNMDEDKAAKIWAVMALLIIGATIAWIISAEYYYGTYSANIDKGYPTIVKHIFGSGSTSQFGFWAFFSPSFGIYGAFIAAGIALIGVYVK